MDTKAPRAPSRPRAVLCAICNAPFETRHSQGKYCSPNCARDGERKSWREYGDRNRDRRRVYQREHYAENADQIIERTAAYLKTPAGRRAKSVSGQRQKTTAPEKIAARHAVKVALQNGEMLRAPCERCGGQPAQAHHPDYSKPLEVVWLCRPCHLAEHGWVPRSRSTAIVQPAAE